MSSTTILLSPELRAKVEAKTKECFKIAEKKHKVKFEMPEIRYNVKSTTAGLAYHQKWLIRYNLILMVENEEHFLNQTVPHEVAHLINRKVNKVPEGKKRLPPHGKGWKEVMELLGVPAHVTHSYDCTSIDRAPRAKRKTTESKVARLLNQIKKLNEEDKAFLVDRIENGDIY
jgi:SprT protein